MESSGLGGRSLRSVKWRVKLERGKKRRDKKRKRKSAAQSSVNILWYQYHRPITLNGINEGTLIVIIGL